MIMRYLRGGMSPKVRGLCLVVPGISSPRLRCVACADGCQGDVSDAIEPTKEEKGAGPWYEE
jgi:hypothetical protein